MTQETIAIACLPDSSFAAPGTCARRRACVAYRNRASTKGFTSLERLPPRPNRVLWRRHGGGLGCAVIERKASEPVDAVELVNVVALAGLCPIDGREIEEPVVGPARQQAEDVA
jgi:hypothetical protein